MLRPGEKEERTRSLETLLSDERDGRLRQAVAQALGAWLEASPLGYTRAIGTLSRAEMSALADEAISAFIKAAMEERAKGAELSPVVQWLFSA